VEGGTGGYSERTGQLTREKEKQAFFKKNAKGSKRGSRILLFFLEGKAAPNNAGRFSKGGRESLQKGRKRPRFRWASGEKRRGYGKPVSVWENLRVVKTLASYAKKKGLGGGRGCKKFHKYEELDYHKKLRGGKDSCKIRGAKISTFFKKLRGAGGGQKGQLKKEIRRQQKTSFHFWAVNPQKKIPGKRHWKVCGVGGT